MQDSAPDSPGFVTLPDRGAVRVSGPDRRGFLQGLISNDIALLDRQPMVYACLLTPQGKFLHDFFVTEQGDTILLESEGGDRAQTLGATLKKFRLRSKIDIEVLAEKSVYIGDGGIPDPRHAQLGHRLYTSPVNGQNLPFVSWDRHRIMLGIPDGSRDMIPDKSTLLECEIDRLNGVSFGKGCYMGQELTARMHYRGLAKKHLYPVRTTTGDPLPAPGTALLAGPYLIGEMRSSCLDIGLALLKDDALDRLHEAELMVLE